MSKRRIGWLDQGDQVYLSDGDSSPSALLYIKDSGRCLRVEHPYLFRVWETSEGLRAELDDDLGDPVAMLLWQALEPREGGGA